ncbi:hypothetical protein [Streptosporangium sp. NPDC023615]|uniref:hypothetical protein n=1 Tax=Streptosporangium sp. NPDC023615 TaxID=3154794 RepID=UPI0034444603
MGNDHAIHHIKFDGESAPAVGSRDHYSKYSADEIKAMLEATNPRAIEEAGHTYKTAASTLGESHALIRDVASQLAQVWSGDASIEAQKALQLVHGTVHELAIRCGQLGPPLVRYGGEVLPTFIEAAAQRPSLGFLDGVDFLPGDDIAFGKVGNQVLFTNKSTNDFAREDLVNLNKNLVELYDTIPATVEKNLPFLGGPADPALAGQNYPGGLPGGGLPGGGVPGGGAPGGGGYGGSLPGGGGYGGGYSGGGYPGGGGGYSSPDLPGHPGGGGSPGGGNPPGYPGVTDPGGNHPANPGAGNPAGPGVGNPAYPGVGNPGAGQPGTGTVPAPYSPGDQQAVPNPNDPRATKVAGFEPTTPAMPTAPTVPTGPGVGTGPGTGLPTYTGGGTGPVVPSLGPNGPNGLNTPAGPGTWVGNGGTAGGAGGLNAVGGIGGTRAAGAGGMGGMPFMPMGGAPGDGNQDRERSTWLVEDEDVWGGDSGTAPAVIT